jgi:hypothetical protein
MTDLSDAMTIFGFLFLGDPLTLSCKESADTNNELGNCASKKTLTAA